MSWWSVHLGLAASLGNLHQSRTSRSAAMSCQRSKQKNRHLLRCIGPETCHSRNATDPHYHALNHPVLSRNALFPPLCPSVRFDAIPLGQMPPPSHVSVIETVSHVGIEDMSFTRSDPVGAVLPASDLVVVSILTHAHDDFLLTLSRSHLPAARPLLCYSFEEFAVTGFPSASGQVLQSRPALGLCMTFLSAVVTLSPIVVIHSRGDSFLASLPSLPLPLLFG